MSLFTLVTFIGGTIAARFDCASVQSRTEAMKALANEVAQHDPNAVKVVEIDRRFDQPIATVGTPFYYQGEPISLRVKKADVMKVQECGCETVTLHETNAMGCSTIAFNRTITCGVDACEGEIAF